MCDINSLNDYYKIENCFNILFWPNFVINEDVLTDTYFLFSINDCTACTEYQAICSILSYSYNIA